LYEHENFKINYNIIVTINGEIGDPYIEISKRIEARRLSYK